jgi:hypothetical protein
MNKGRRSPVVVNLGGAASNANIELAPVNVVVSQPVFQSKENKQSGERKWSGAWRNSRHSIPPSYHKPVPHRLVFTMVVYSASFFLRL